MSFREQVIRAIKHEKTERTPWAFEVTAAFSERYKKEYPCPDVEQDLDSHIMFGRYKVVTWINPFLYEDAFGVKWQLGEDGGDIGIPVNNVIDEDGIDQYVFPETNQGILQKAIRSMREDTDHFRMFRLTYALYERAWALMGMENLLVNMAIEEQATMRLFERVTEYTLNLLDQVLDEEFEGVYFGDDWGKQKGLIMGPQYWRKYIKPFLAQMFAKVKAKGKYVLLHSCGDITEIFPDLIEIGLDVYNTVQPEIYDLSKIKSEYGRDLTFWGAMSTQQYLPYRTVQEVFDKSVETIKILGKDGGYLFSPTHAVTPDIPTANIRAMYDAVQSVRW